MSEVRSQIADFEFSGIVFSLSGFLYVNRYLSYLLHLPHTAIVSHFSSPVKILFL